MPNLNGCAVLQISRVEASTLRALQEQPVALDQCLKIGELRAGIAIAASPRGGASLWVTRSCRPIFKKRISPRQGIGNRRGILGGLEDGAAMF